MKITFEMSLHDFTAWGGGAQTMDDLGYYDIDELERYLEGLYPDSMTDTELNDFLWFQREEIASILGYRDYEALCSQDKEDWDDHARTVINENVPEADDDMIEEYVCCKVTEDVTDEETIENFKEFMEEYKTKNSEE